MKIETVITILPSDHIIPILPDMSFPAPWSFEPEALEAWRKLYEAQLAWNKLCLELLFPDTLPR